VKQETPQATAGIPALRGGEEVNRETEDATERDRPRYQRELFDGVAHGQGGLTLAPPVTMARVRRPASGG
jgi:hypothetical protein